MFQAHNMTRPRYAKLSPSSTMMRRKIISLVYSSYILLRCNCLLFLNINLTNTQLQTNPRSGKRLRKKDCLNFVKQKRREKCEQQKNMELLRIEMQKNEQENVKLVWIVN